MEYAGSYALYNYRLLDPELGFTYDNIAPIRAFEHGLDRTSSEAGFVLQHVDMVKESPKLVAGAIKALKGAEHAASDGDKQMFKDGLREVVDSLDRINRVMESMRLRRDCQYLRVLTRRSQECGRDPNLENTQTFARKLYCNGATQDSTLTLPVSSLV